MSGIYSKKLVRKILIQNKIESKNANPDQEVKLPLKNLITAKLGQTRIGHIRNTLYIWLRNNHPDSWLYLYRNEIFHLKSLTTKTKLVDKTCQNLNLSRLSLSNLVLQITKLYPNSKKRNHYVSDIGIDRVTIRGEVLQFLLDATNTTLTEIQPLISHIGSGRNGQGVIRNPQFPSIEPLRTRLLATMLSDGHLTARRQLNYFESDLERIVQVIELVNLLGDVNYFTYQISEKVTRINFPTVLGRLLEQWGMPVGDKTLQKIHLPPYLLQGPMHLKCAYFSEMIPEDGCFCEKKPEKYGAFEWSRSKVLYDYYKAKKYHFKQKLSENHLDFIRRFGKKKDSFGNRTVIELRPTNLEKLESSGDLKTATMARDLMSIVLENPHSLLDDEVQLAQSLGIQLAQYVSRICFFEKTKRVSVIWSATTSRRKDTIRLGLLAPPNCDRKSNAFTNWIIRQPITRVQNAIGESYLEVYESNK